MYRIRRSVIAAGFQILGFYLGFSSIDWTLDDAGMGWDREMMKKEKN
jgi:hypothetical protein